MKERDFIKIKNYMFVLSAVVLLLGVIFYVINGGFRYGIDFQGGSQLQVSLGMPSSVSELKGILGNEVSIIRIEGEEERSDSFLIKVAVSGISPDEIKRVANELISKIEDKYKVLKLNGDIRSSKDSVSFELGIFELDIKEGKKKEKAEIDKKLLSSYLGKGFSVEKTDDNKAFLITSSISQFIAQKTIISPLAEKFKGLSIENSTTYDPTQGEVIKGQALKVGLLILVLILLYIGLRFQFRFGIAAIIALLHDSFILICFMLFFNREIDISSVVALLTIMGYSLNDTIVVFDRIRENQKLLATSDYVLVINKSISQSLSRTLVTSLTTLFVVLCIYVIGGVALENLSFALLVGVIVGTYSSIFIASPALVIWENISSARLIQKEKKSKISKKKKVLA